MRTIIQHFFITFYKYIHVLTVIEFMNCNLVQKRKNDDNKSEHQPAAKKFQYNMFVSAGTSAEIAENDKKEEKDTPLRYELICPKKCGGLGSNEFQLK